MAAPGCRWFHRKAPATASPRPSPTVTTNQPSSLIVAPTATAKVARVNKQSKIAVLIFPIGQVPPANTTMVVYRGDAKTGEVRITGPTSENITVADILVGTVEENDEVRSE